MSLFDAVANALWAAAKITHGDSAIYRYASGGTASITVICHLDAEDIGSQFEMRKIVRRIEINALDVSRPISGDQIEVSAGKHAGTYTVSGIDDEDEYSYWVTVA